VGPHAHLNGATVDDEVFLATGVSVFPGARIGHGSEVRINAVVHVNSALAPGTTVPIGWIAVGDPAELFPPERHDELWAIQERMDFPRTVFGMPREEATMERVARRYSESFGRHRGDRVLRT
jgi:carbonic anhydrase/acetyltransferase-like protein (isoleucine patch superfamily)